MSNLICPHCGLPAAFTPIFLSRTSDYNFVNGTVAAAKDDRIVEAKMNFPHGDTQYAILCCQSCGGFYVAANIYHGWFTVHPIPHKKDVSEYIVQPIKEQFEEASLCFAIGAYNACVMMCQVALESLWRNKNVSGLNELRDSGIISRALFDRATEIRLWAGLTKHKTLIETVSEDDAKQLLTYLEIILEHVYVEPKRFNSLKEKREGIDKV